jgi:hypothetical protein
MNASHDAYAAAYTLAWASITPFIVLAIMTVASLQGVKELMTEHVDATVGVCSLVERKEPKRQLWWRKRINRGAKMRESFRHMLQTSF